MHHHQLNQTRVRSLVHFMAGIIVDRKSITDNTFNCTFDD